MSLAKALNWFNLAGKRCSCVFHGRGHLAAETDGQGGADDRDQLRAGQ
jgi:hypothetical protein